MSDKKDLDVEAAKYELLPTGKPHVSWSETKTWAECSYRHKLAAVDKINLGKPSPVLGFGTAVHASCEDYLKTRVMRSDIACDIIRDEFVKNVGVEKFTPGELDLMLKQAPAILADVPQFLDLTFPGWSTIEAEHTLYEPITPEKTSHAFKGFIDAVLLTPNPKGEHLKPFVHVLDWKTTNSFWSADKKSDPLMIGQLAAYKNYWMQEHNIALTDIRTIKCGFVLLKRNAKPGNHCELVPVSVGEITMGRTLKVINNCVTSIKRGVAIKNRDACRWCDYKNTEHCT